MSLTVEQTPRPPGDEQARSFRRGRALLLAETAFARCVGVTLSGTFLTALVLALGGDKFEMGAAVAAGQIGSVGMLVANPILNRLGSRRVFCLVSLGLVRLLRIVIAALPLWVYLGVARGQLIWALVAALVASAVFGMSAEISRRSWISDLVEPPLRGRFFSRRVMIGSLTNMVVLLAGGWFLDRFYAPPADRLTGLAVVIGFGALMGWSGWLLLWRTPEPAMSLPRRRTGLLRSVALPWARPRFRPLIVAGASNALATGVCGGFFNLYMLQHLGMRFAWVAAVNIVGELVAIAGAPVYGAWADRAGARRVLTVAILVKGVFPALWILVAPETWPLAFVVVLARTFNSAGQISWLRLSLNLSPARNQAAFLAMHQALMGAGHAVGALSGGLLAEWMKQFHMALWGFQLVPLHVLFAVSATLRLASATVVRFIREPQRALRRVRPQGEWERPDGAED